MQQQLISVYTFRYIKSVKVSFVIQCFFLLLSRDWIILTKKIIYLYVKRKVAFLFLLFPFCSVTYIFPRFYICFLVTRAFHVPTLFRIARSDRKSLALPTPFTAYIVCSPLFGYSIVLSHSRTLSLSPSLSISLSLALAPFHSLWRIQVFWKMYGDAWFFVYNGQCSAIRIVYAWCSYV